MNAPSQEEIQAWFNQSRDRDVPREVFEAFQGLVNANIGGPGFHVNWDQPVPKEKPLYDGRVFHLQHPNVFDYESSRRSPALPWLSPDSLSSGSG